jgi:hypothetical protein
MFLFQSKQREIIHIEKKPRTNPIIVFLLPTLPPFLFAIVAMNGKIADPWYMLLQWS